MLKRTGVTGLFLVLLSIMYAQEGEGVKFEKDRLFTGGNLGLQFGTYTVVDISPVIGYFITDKISFGTGATYQYYQYKDKVYPAFDFKTNIYGAKLFSRFYIIPSVFVHAEYEALNLETAYFDPTHLRHSTDRFWVHSVLLGGGYKQAIGEYSSINIMLLYNINETVDSPYRNPIIRMGFDIGL